MKPLFVPQSLYDRAKVDPRYRDACERGDIRPVPLIPPVEDVRRIFRCEI